jgi:squalene-associated FAD-dependent desaturase
MSGAVHIIGAGLAGLAAAIRLADSPAEVIVHEATNQAGGRCRSYFDAASGLTIDNGNHLLLSGNHAAQSYVKRIGTQDALIGPAEAAIPFVDLASGEHWTICISDGRLPRWIFDANARVPGTSALNYAGMARLLWPGKSKTICETINCSGPVYERLVRPFLLAALNIDPSQGSAALAGAVVRETLAAGGAACRPLIARDGLSGVFVAPALTLLRQKGKTVRFGRELQRLVIDAATVTALEFADETVPLGPADQVIMAVPSYAAKALVPGLNPPSQFRSILNAHFKIEPPAHLPAMQGVLNGLVEWIFTFPGRLSITISNADRLLDQPREALAQAIWNEVARIAGLNDRMPRWQIVRERRATFAATPAENAMRPGATTRWRNLFLAGDWTATGLPATIEGAIRSGDRAADCVLRATV